MPKLMFDSLPVGPPAFDDLPQPPPGFVLDQPPHSVPALPPGYKLDQPTPRGPFQQAAPAVDQQGTPASGPRTEFQQKPQPDVLTDVAKQLPTGIVEGAAKLFTGDALSDMGSMAGNGLVWLANKIAPDNDIVKRIVGAKKALDALSIPADKDPFSVTSILPAPQTGAGGVARTVGNLAASVGAAPEAGAAGLAKAFVKQAAIPGLASEGAGALTEGTELEPAARIGTALAAGGLATRSKLPTPVSSEDVGTAQTAAFDRFRNASVAIKPWVVENAAQKIQNDLAASGLSFAPANKIVEPYLGNTTKPVTLNQLQETRTLLGKAASALSLRLRGKHGRRGI